MRYYSRYSLRKDTLYKVFHFHWSYNHCTTIEVHSTEEVVKSHKSLSCLPCFSWLFISKQWLHCLLQKPNVILRKPPSKSEEKVWSSKFSEFNSKFSGSWIKIQLRYNRHTPDFTGTVKQFSMPMRLLHHYRSSRCVTLRLVMASV